MTDIPDDLLAERHRQVNDMLERLGKRQRGELREELAMPWPELTEPAGLRHHHCASFVAQRGTHEATIGRRLAAHFAKSMRVLLFTGYPPADAPAWLEVNEAPTPTPEQVDAAVRRFAARGERLGLVVIERAERMKLEQPWEGCTRVQELEECFLRLRQFVGHGRRTCPLILTTVTDRVPDFKRTLVEWAGTDSPAAILTDYSTRVVVLRRQDDEIVTGEVEIDTLEMGWIARATFPIAWPLPAGAKRMAAKPGAPKVAPDLPAAPRRAQSDPSDGVQALETEYAGHRFRSRLEARWAVFLDRLGVAWEYEPERYQLASGKYLPDFWLPAQQFFLEVKGVAPSASYRALLEELAVGMGHRVVLAVGSIPNPDRYEVGVEGESDFWLAAAYPDGSNVSWLDGHTWCRCPECGSFDVRLASKYDQNYCGCSPEPGLRLSGATAPALAAFRAARSARFEHGESGA